jgi:hypothetical protein
MNCKFCGEPVEEKPGGHRIREYCHDAHRQAYWRQQQKQDQDAALQASLEALRAKVKEQAHTIELQQQEIERLAQHYTLARQFQDDGNALAQEIAQLKKRLDFERRYVEDTTPQRFKAWLRKQPSSPWRVTFLSDQTIKPLASRSYYEAQMKRLHCSDEEHEDFVRLWKLMLLQS